MKRFILILILLLTLVATVGCAKRGSLDNSLNSILKGKTFSFVDWERTNLTYKFSQWVKGEAKVGDGTALVKEYFDIAEDLNGLEYRIELIKMGTQPGDINALEVEADAMRSRKESIEGRVEMILEKQISSVLAEQGIYNPLVPVKIGFPPVNFKMDRMPLALIVSPRDKIFRLRQINLEPGLTLEQVEDIENQIDDLGTSSLIVELGGVGAAYPTMVADDGSLRFTIDAATEEWAHQYLTFRPLGFLYVLDLLGIKQNYDVATIDETVAGIVSKEIGTMVYEKYYGPVPVGHEQPPAGFDFNAAMRQTRLQVDSLLAQGKVDEGEQYMDQQREFLQTKGYYIRKLNQAYFAFYGAYADSPTSVSPIGAALKKLRAQTQSLKVFLDQTAGMRGLSDLNKVAK